MMEPEFVEWPKIPRLNREIIVTEKIDGTNAAVIVLDDGSVHAQSRTRIITPEKDNFGFAQWVAKNAQELVEKLGPGHHFGEWYGRGIQRGYGLPDRRFMLFNVARWEDAELPEGVEVASVLYRGPFYSAGVNGAVSELRDHGSWQVRGFDKPEGVVVFHTAANMCFKVLCERDAIPKGASA